MHAGEYHRNDCDLLKAGQLTEGEAYCTAGDTRDCILHVVGPYVAQFGFSFPVNVNFAHALSWASTKTKLEGKLAQASQDFEANAPRSVCAETADASEDLSIGPDGMKGAFFACGTAAAAVAGRLCGGGGCGGHGG